MDQIRVDQQNLPKKERYGIGELLKTIDLKRPTYYDERKRIINKNDKYADVKVVIKEIAEKGKWRGSYTYGYRRIMPLLEKAGYHMAEATLRRLMNELGVQPAIYQHPADSKTLIPFVEKSKWLQNTQVIVADAGYGSEQNYNY